MAYDLQQALMDAINSGGAMPGGAGLAASDSGSLPPDQYQARIDELIRTLSQPDQPQLLPTQGAPTKAQATLAFLGDALANIGAAKNRYQLPGNVYGEAIARQRDYEAAAQQENARRVAQAGIQGKKTGAMLSLQDIEKARAENAVATQKSIAGRAAFEKDQNARALKSGGVPTVDAEGNRRPDAAIEQDISAWKQKADQQHQALWQQNYDLRKRKVDLYAQHIAQMNRTAAARLAQMTPDERRMMDSIKAQISVATKAASQANERMRTAANNGDDAEAASWQQVADQNMAQADQLAQQLGIAPTATAAPAPTATGPKLTITRVK